MQQALFRTALVTCYYGGKNDLRRDATLRAIKEWDGQKYLPHQSVFLELVCPEQEPCFSYPDFPNWLKYIRIYGKSRNRNLFQKEALWNLGTRFVSACKLFFVDSDCMPIDCKDWFRRIFDLCAPGKCVHAAWRLLHEKQTAPFDEYYSQFASRDTVPQGKRCFPGLGYGIHRDDFNAIDGFNPFGITGGGDCIFIKECMEEIAPDYSFAKHYFNSLLRPNRPQLTPVVPLSVTVQHNYHGDRLDRSYRYSREVIDLFGSPRAYCHIDRSGLVAWNDPRFWLADIANEKTRMHTRQELLDLVAESAAARLQHLEEVYRDKTNNDYNSEDFNDN